MAHGRGRHASELADALAGQGQRRRRARKPERQLPRAAGLQESRRPTMHCPPITSRTTARPASSGRCRSAAANTGAAISRRPWTCSSAAGRSPASTPFTPGEMVTLQLQRRRPPFQVSAITNDFSGGNNYRPNVTCDPYAPAGQQSITNWFNPACVALPTDPSQPFGNAAAQQCPRPEFLAGRSGGDQVGSARRPSEDAGADRNLQPVRPGELHLRPRATAAIRPSARSPRPTTRVRCSWG